MDERPEQDERLWRLAVAPAIWVAHLVTSYLTVAIWCAKVVPREGALGPARGAVVAYTAVALLAITITGWRAFRRHRYGAAAAPHDFDTPGDRHRFLGFATLLLSIVSAIGVVYVGLPTLFIGTCR